MSKVYSSRELAEKLGVVSRTVRRFATKPNSRQKKIQRIGLDQYIIVDDEDEGVEQDIEPEVELDVEHEVNDIVDVLNDEKRNKSSVHTDRYFYTGVDTDEYLFIHNKDIIKIKGKEVRAWYDYYSTHGVGVNDVCRKFEIDRNLFLSIKQALYLTHSSMSFTDEEAMYEDEETLIRSELERKKRKITVEANKRFYAAIEKDANSVRNLNQLIEDAIVNLDFSKLKIDRNIINNNDITKSNYTLVYCQADLHIGKRQYGNSGYSIHTQLSEYAGLRNKAVNRILNTWGTPDNMVYVNVGDFFHVDTNKSQTTSQKNYIGDTMTVSPVDMFSYGSKYILEELLSLRESFKVSTINAVITPGNHDRLLGHAMKTLVIHALKSVVNVIDGDLHVPFMVYDTPLLATHGDNLKAISATSHLLRNLPVGADVKKAVVLSGHYHEPSLNIVNGVVHIVCSSPTPQDSWESEKGYGGRRGMIALRITPSGGLSDLMFVPLE